jgi:hypothetical protein
MGPGDGTAHSGWVCGSAVDGDTRPKLWHETGLSCGPSPFRECFEVWFRDGLLIHTLARDESVVGQIHEDMRTSIQRISAYRPNSSQPVDATGSQGRPHRVWAQVERCLQATVWSGVLEASAVLVRIVLRPYW